VYDRLDPIDATSRYDLKDFALFLLISRRCGVCRKAVHLATSATEIEELASKGCRASSSHPALISNFQEVAMQ
jgi:hypothetical protein